MTAGIVGLCETLGARSSRLADELLDEPGLIVVLELVCRTQANPERAVGPQTSISKQKVTSGSVQKLSPHSSISLKGDTLLFLEVCTAVSSSSPRITAGRRSEHGDSQRRYESAPRTCQPATPSSATPIQQYYKKSQTCATPNFFWARPPNGAAGA